MDNPFSFRETLKEIGGDELSLIELVEQAELFGLEIDFETFELVEPNTYTDPYWLANWRDKQASADINNRFDYDEPESRK